MNDAYGPPVVKLVRTTGQRRREVSEETAFYVVAVMCIYGIAYALLILLHPFHERMFVAVSDGAGIAPPAIAGMLALVAAYRSGAHVRTGWILVGAGCLAWGAGDAVWFVYEVLLQRDPFPSLADAGYLTMLPLLAFGLVLLTSEGRSLLRCQPTLDGIALTLALATFVWLFALEPTYAASGSSTLEKTIASAYPIGDLALCFALAVAIQRRWNRHDLVVLISLLAGMLALVATDVGFAFHSIEGDYTSGSFVNVGWPWGFLAIAVSAGLSTLWSPAYTTSESLSGPPTWRVLLPVALLVPQVCFLAWSLRENAPASSAPVAIMTAIVILAVISSLAVHFGLVREVKETRRQTLLWLEDFRHRRAG